MHKIIRNLEKVIIQYIPKNNKCRIEEQKREFRREKEKQEILSHVKEKQEMGLSVELKIEWVEQDPDMSVCSVCKEVIYSNQYELKHYLNGEEIKKERPA